MYTWKLSQIWKVHGANIGPTWVLSAPDRPHVSPMYLGIRTDIRKRYLRRVYKLTSWDVTIYLCPGYLLLAPTPTYRKHKGINEMIHFYRKQLILESNTGQLPCLKASCLFTRWQKCPSFWNKNEAIFIIKHLYRKNIFLKDHLPLSQ